MAVPATAIAVTTALAGHCVTVLNATRELVHADQNRRLKHRGLCNTLGERSGICAASASQKTAPA